MALRVVITGATGNVGSAVLRALARDDAVDTVVGVARRIDGAGALSGSRKASFVAADVAAADLRSLFEGADAVIHLAWALQPAHDGARLWRTNVLGSRRVIDAAAAAGVGRLLVASSVGTYAPGPQDRLVDESWPVTGIATSTYSTQKADLEWACDRAAAGGLQVIRLRPALIFQRASAMSQRFLFAGRLLPTPIARRRLWPVLPWIDQLRFQAVHADDVAEAYRLALHADTDGAFNIAAEPVVTGPLLARHLGARHVDLPPRALRYLHAAGFGARLVSSEPGWLDLACASPLIDPRRAEQELGWSPARSSLDALDELAGGLRDRIVGGTAALSASPA